MREDTPGDSTGFTEPRWRSSALVTVDLQNDFLDGGASPVPGTGAVVPTVAALAASFRGAGLPVVHVVRLYVPGGSDTDLPRRSEIEQGGRIVAPGSPGSRPAAGLLPRPVDPDPELLLASGMQDIGPGEVMMFKPRWSAFHRTGLEQWLRGHGCDTVVVAGCNLPNCPRATLFDASERDFRSVLAVDAVSGTSPERLADLEGIGVVLLDSASIIAEVTSGDGQGKVRSGPGASDGTGAGPGSL